MDEITAVQYFLNPGYIYVPNEPTVISTVLGSCVSVCLFDRKRRVGGMNHFRMPRTTDRHRATATYGNVATLALVSLMLANGSKSKHIEAQILGGAFNPEISTEDVGRENIRVARGVLTRKNIRIVSEDVGGCQGRKVVFNTHTNEVGILKVSALRRGDWAPYISDR